MREITQKEQGGLLVGRPGSDKLLGRGHLLSGKTQPDKSRLRIHRAIALHSFAQHIKTVFWSKRNIRQYDARMPPQEILYALF